MKKATFLTILVFSFFCGYTQRLSINVMPGLMNYAGDLQPSPLTFQEACPAITAGLQYKLTNNLYVRGDYTVGQVKADDKLNIERYRPRNLNFKSIILEGSFSLEYDFFKLRINKGWTPYIFAGVGYFYFSPYTYDTAGVKYYLEPLGTEGQGLPQYPGRKFYKLYQFDIPAGFGVKYAVSDRVSIGFEVCFRKLFTDYLDDVSTTYPDPTLLLIERGPKSAELSYRAREIPGSNYPITTPRGGPNSKDDFYTGLFKFTYTFPTSNAALTRGDRKAVSCPRLVL